jgi:hypothetical protein
MSHKRQTKHLKKDKALSAAMSQRLEGFLGELMGWLDEKLDKRLVRTFRGLIPVILIFRDRPKGLLLSELGGYLLNPDPAPAGTKRISNLLRSCGWGYGLIERFLWSRAHSRVAELHAADKTAYALWDERVIEKGESLALEGLGPVRSRQAARLNRIRPGFYTPPKGSTFGPGMDWLAVLVIGLSGPPLVAAMKWWTRRGPLVREWFSQWEALLQESLLHLGPQLIHIFDRGFANLDGMGVIARYPLRFIIRWSNQLELTDLSGRTMLAWQLVRGKPTWEFRHLRDSRRNCLRKMGVLALPVTYAAYAGPLWLVVCRRGKGQTPWYLLTTEPILTAEQAWRIVLAYARRWQIEMTFRFAKSALAFESPRLWRWDHRLKLLLIATLAYAFLLSLLDPALADLRQILLRHWCHRTGQRLKQVKAPLYRLRAALSRLWLAFPPPILAINTQISG